MKKVFGITLIIMIALFTFSACNNTNPSGGTNHTPPESDTPAAVSNVLIAYFSCTGTTKGVAEHIEEKTGGTLYEIVPQIPYTEADLAYYTGGRADKEQADPTARPAISERVEKMENYDVIFLGYPIWHGQAPKIIYTFLESYDFSGKTIIPFCTSHSSGMGSSATNLHSLVSGATWRDGRRFPSETSRSTVDEWVDSLGLNFTPDVSVFDLESGENGHAPR